MKKVLLIIALAFLAGPLHAQASHSVALTWTDTTNPAATVYNVYRATALTCSATSTFTKVGSNVAAKTYTDSFSNSGSYCYQVTSVSGGIESNPSNQVLVLIKPDPPTNLQAVYQ